MGTINIQFKGSFGDKPPIVFSAMDGGHAFAISQAIEYLNGKMGEAIVNDHALHDKGERPPKGNFGKPML